MFTLEQKTFAANLGTPKQVGICKVIYHENTKIEKKKLMAIMRNSNNIHLAPLKRLAVSGTR